MKMVQNRVGFSRPIVIPTYKIFIEFNDEKYMRKNSTNVGNLA
jgi:hypothetical protein